MKITRKHKILFAAAGILLAVMLVLPACTATSARFQKQPEPPETAYQVGIYDVLDNGFPLTIPDYLDGFKVLACMPKSPGNVETAPDVFSCEFLGITYEGSYFSSEVPQFTCDREDVYYSEDRNVMLKRNARDGSLSGFRIFGKALERADAAQPICKDRLAVAKQAVEQYLPIDGYRVTDRGETSDGTREYWFEKYIGEWKTTDRALVKVTTHGTVCEMQLRNIGRFDGIQMSDFDYGEMKKSAERLVYVTYADMMNYTMTYYPEGLAFTQDGALVFAGNASIRVDAYNPDSANYPSLQRFGIGYKQQLYVVTVLRGDPADR